MSVPWGSVGISAMCVDIDADRREPAGRESSRTPRCPRPHGGKTTTIDRTSRFHRRTCVRFTSMPPRLRPIDADRMANARRRTPRTRALPHARTPGDTTRCTPGTCRADPRTPPRRGPPPAPPAAPAGSATPPAARSPRCCTRSPTDHRSRDPVPPQYHHRQWAYVPGRGRHVQPHPHIAWIQVEPQSTPGHAQVDTGRLSGSTANPGSPIAALHATHEPTRYRGSSPCLLPRT